MVLDTLHVPLLLQNLVQAAAVHSRGWSDGARSSWPLVSTLQDEGWPQDRPLSPELDPLGLPLGVGEVFNVIGVDWANLELQRAVSNMHSFKLKTAILW